MTKEGIYEVGDTLTVGDRTLRAVLAATDNTGCYVCDNGQCECYFCDNEHLKDFGGKCPKCHSNVFCFNDYLGKRVIFI